MLNLVEQLSSEKNRAIVVFDEFQEVPSIDPNLPRLLRSVMQQHQRINYIFLGSQESLIRNIFEKKKSPFYHFGMLMLLGKISREDFEIYLSNGFRGIKGMDKTVVADILKFTGCHPYYTQQLAFVVWERLNKGDGSPDPIEQAIEELVRIHDMDYERIWNGFNKTDKKLLIGLTLSAQTPLSEAFYRKYGLGASSTVFSSLKRMMQQGSITKTGNAYEIDDPFFERWIIQRRGM